MEKFIQTAAAWTAFFVTGSLIMVPFCVATESFINTNLEALGEILFIPVGLFALMLSIKVADRISGN